MSGTDLKAEQAEGAAPERSRPGGGPVGGRSRSRGIYGGDVAVHDGNGWVRCRCGQRHWGLHGAAGLVVLRARPRTGASGPADGIGADPERAGTAPTELLLQLRATWTHQGGSWGLPGGARDSHESTVTAALREAQEEAGIEPAELDVVGERGGLDHGDWSYTYVLALAGPALRPVVCNPETDELRWVELDRVAELPLHPGLAAAWPDLAVELEAGYRAHSARSPSSSSSTPATAPASRRNPS